ncbi:PEGA domain-containing protein [Candidatus Woesebacteria bacterium]|nr:MAG: PEGA domain-containing protein [Candidatus Woesebacteria bacterium]
MSTKKSKGFSKINLIRLGLFSITGIIVISVATVLGLFASGYRFSKDTGLSPHGLLAIKSQPTGAQVFVNGEVKSATDDTIPLVPGNYDIEVRKDGFMTWSKRLTLEAEIVTEVKAQLFKLAPSLTAATLTGALNPTPSRDFTKIAYAIPPQTSIVNPANDKNGLWIFETINLPVGFSREPRKITDGDLTNSTWIWSPDGREILLTTPKGAYLINSQSFTPQNERINITIQKELILKEWETDWAKIINSQKEELPDELAEILNDKASQVLFSPDNDMVMYLASGSATIKDNLVKPFPGSSTQKQDRNIKTNHTYVYDIEEDRNYLIDDTSEGLIIEGGYSDTNNTKRASWFPTSRNIILADRDKVVIMDYDGTNRQTVYSGNYILPYAFPTVSDDRLILLTNFGATDTYPNLYSVSLR